MPTPVKKAALELGVPVHEPTSLREFTQAHSQEAYDLFALASYGKILPQALLQLPKLGALNVHPSLLPKYRGATPLQTALRNGDTLTGVSIMLMDAGMDTGPLVLQETAAIDPADDYGTLHDRLAELGAQLLTRAIKAAQSGSLESHPQQGEPSVTKPIGKEDLEIDFSWPAQRIVNAVRAFAPAPGARARVRDIPVKILAAQIERASDALAIACGDGEVYLTRLVPPGKNVMSGAAFDQFSKAAAR